MSAHALETTHYPQKRQRTHVLSIASSKLYLPETVHGDQSLLELPSGFEYISDKGDSKREIINELAAPQWNTLEIREHSEHKQNNNTAHQLARDNFKQPGKLDWRTAQTVTALFVTVRGQDSLNIRQRVDTAVQLLEQIEGVAFLHHASVVGKRLDTGDFILKSENMQSDTNQVSPIEDGGQLHATCSKPMVDQMLALAADLYQRLRSITARRSSAIQVVMGMACGSMTELGSRFGGSWAACSAVGVRGDAIDLAEQMAEAGASGTVMVHESALLPWAASGRRPPTASGHPTPSDGPPMGRGAVFDLVTQTFLRPAAQRGPDGRGGAQGMRLGKSASFA